MSDLQINQIQVNPDQIDFGIGQPGFDLLPLKLMRRAAQRRLAADDATLLNYGHAQGDGRFRQSLAHFLTAQYETAVSPQHLFLTAGASQGLDFLCTMLTQPGDTIFVEEPTYFLALRIFADHKLNIVGIPLDDDGLNLDALEAALRQHTPVFLYTIPTYQNPTGITLSAERRAALLALAQRHNFRIVADEVYHLLHYGLQPPPPLAAFSDSEQVISVGSFSKICAPGLRLGWLQAAPAVLAPLADAGLVDSGGGLSHFTANLVQPLLDSGDQDEYVRQLRHTYRRRVQTMAAALAAQLGDRVQFVVPQGGFFFWCTVAGVDTAVLLPHAVRYGTGFQPGAKFSSQQGCHHQMRLSFAFYDQAAIATGIARLAQTIADVA